MINLNKPELATSTDSTCPGDGVFCPTACVSLREVTETSDIGLEVGADVESIESRFDETDAFDFTGTSIPKETVEADLTG